MVSWWTRQFLLVTWARLADAWTTHSSPAVYPSAWSQPPPPPPLPPPLYAPSPLGEVALALLLLPGRHGSCNLGFELHMGCGVKQAQGSLSRPSTQLPPPLRACCHPPRANAPRTRTNHAGAPALQPSGRGAPCPPVCRTHLQAARLDGLLHRPHHLLNIVTDVLLARALEGDLGAHNAHKHAHLRYGVRTGRPLVVY